MGWLAGSLPVPNCQDQTFINLTRMRKSGNRNLLQANPAQLRPDTTSTSCWDHSHGGGREGGKEPCLDLAFLGPCCCVLADIFLKQPLGQASPSSLPAPLARPRRAGTEEQRWVEKATLAQKSHHAQISEKASMNGLLAIFVIASALPGLGWEQKH